MFTGLISFLGGGIFRAIWGEVAGWITKFQDHNQELEAMKLQDELAQNQHAREMDRLKVSSQLNIQQIQVQGDVDIQNKDAEAFIAAMATVNQKTGINWVDAWNGSIRPAAASIALLLWVSWLWSTGFKPTEWDKELVGVILGFYFAHRVFANK